MTSRARQLRELLDSSDGTLLVPGAPNALSARVVEEAGFEAAYVSGAGVTNTFLGMPDLGLLTVTELARHVAAMADAVDIPLVVDADTGFGNALNVQRTVRELERAGAAAIQIEDQVSPKKCGHFEGKEVISTAEMVGKIRAALDARADDDTGRHRSHRRRAPSKASRPPVSVRMPTTRPAPTCSSSRRRGTRRRCGTSPARCRVATWPTWSRAVSPPLLTKAELDELGFAIGLYANSAMRGAVLGMRSVLAAPGQARRHPRRRGPDDRLGDRQELVRKPEFDALDRRGTPRRRKGSGRCEPRRYALACRWPRLPARGGPRRRRPAGQRRAHRRHRVSGDDRATPRRPSTLAARPCSPARSTRTCTWARTSGCPKDPDDADLETASAVAGGVTSMLVYLMSAEPYAGVFEPARDVMAKHSRTDFGFHFVLGTPRAPQGAARLRRRPRRLQLQVLHELPR